MAASRWGRTRVLPFWADGGAGPALGGFKPGRHVLTAMPSKLERVTLEALREESLEGWLDRVLGGAEGVVPLRVVGLHYEAGHAGRTLTGGLPPVAAGIVAVVATYPGYLVADDERGPWRAIGDVGPLTEALAHAPFPLEPCPRVELVDPVGVGPYRLAVEAIREGIAAGDHYQVNFTRRLVAELPTELGPSLFMALRAAQPTAFATLWGLEEGWLCSGSPECLLTWDAAERRAHTWPIKGTVGRGGSEGEDLALARRLLASDKDRAEHVMIVDLARNDLGRLAEMGSVVVRDLYSDLPLRTVRHLVSDVSARVREGVSLGELVGALFPGGSITGAPKIAAMNAITRHEHSPRGFYCGSLGVVFGASEAVFSILIRTAVASEGRLTYGVGGGIVWDSHPEDEWSETELKARALERALGGA